MTRILFGLMLLLASTHAVAAVAQSETSLPQLMDIHLSVKPDFENERLSAQARLTIRNNSTNSIRQVPLLLNRLLRVESVQLSSGKALSFQQTVSAFEDFTRWQINVIAVALPAPLAPGASVQLSVRYSGYLASYVETGMQYLKDQISREFTLLREDALAFPVPGHRSLAARNG